MRMVFGEIDPQYLRFWLSVLVIEGVCAKDFEATLLLLDMFKASDSICRGKIEQILLAYALHKETVTVITMVYKNMKAIV